MDKEFIELEQESATLSAAVWELLRQIDITNQKATSFLSSFHLESDADNEQT